MESQLVLVGLVGVMIGGALGAWLTAQRLRTAHVAQLAGLRRERDLLARRADELEARTEDSTDLAMALAPLTSSLARVERQVEGLERERAQQLGQLGERLDLVHRSGEALRAQTAALAGALNAPNVRGAWGEVQLRRVVEHAGMLTNVDFEVQVRGTNDAGVEVRPDAVIRLPGGKQVVIDAKAPMSAFLRSASAHDDRSPQTHAPDRAATRQHAKDLRRHVEALADKRYWTAFTPAPEFVVCFVPGESFLAAACEADPALLEDAMRRQVVLATPSTLLALLKTVATTWQHDALVGSARELLDAGKELYARVGSVNEHFGKLGRSLDRAVQDYNAAIGTFERRVLVSARRMNQIMLDPHEHVPPAPLVVQARPISQAPKPIATEDESQTLFAREPDLAADVDDVYADPLRLDRRGSA